MRRAHGAACRATALEGRRVVRPWPAATARMVVHRGRARATAALLTAAACASALVSTASADAAAGARPSRGRSDISLIATRTTRACLPAPLSSKACAADPPPSPHRCRAIIGAISKPPDAYHATPPCPLSQTQPRAAAGNCGMIRAARCRMCTCRRPTCPCRRGPPRSTPSRSRARQACARIRR